MTGLRRGLDLEINWVGRFGTAAVFGGLFFSMVFDSWAVTALFLAGLALGIYATVLYARAGLLRSRDASARARPSS